EVTEQGKTYTYPQPTDAASASTPGSRFKRRGGSVLLRRGQSGRYRTSCSPRPGSIRVLSMAARISSRSGNGPPCQAPDRRQLPVKRSQLFCVSVDIFVHSRGRVISKSRPSAGLRRNAFCEGSVKCSRRRLIAWAA
ncbi:MAG: hypothetical protein EOO29_20835, partial [Comamonadaceae bacterium]